MKRSLLIAERRMDPDALPKHLMSGKTQAKVIHVLPGKCNSPTIRTRFW
ncbi:hypothetical protein [Hankyongella ginsenosidimutans]|nr:hypothetical protein [Hankyongella ginsenosidimutans]